MASQEKPTPPRDPPPHPPAPEVAPLVCGFGGGNVKKFVLSGHLRWKQWIKKLQFIINIQGSFDEIAIVAGGCDKNGQVLKSAELYNSETGHWETLADMNLARRLSSSFFLDGFYRCKVAYDIALNRPVITTTVFALYGDRWYQGIYKVEVKYIEIKIFIQVRAPSSEGGERPMYATEISFVWPCWLSQPFDMFGKEVTFVSVEF
uniref:Uncharacterized protein n=1 Tax=Oryza glaberrima TaxID=4538 RepID=I1PTW1_ORYGL